MSSLFSCYVPTFYFIKNKSWEWTRFLSPGQAIELKEDFRSALFNLALLLTDDQRPLEAAPFLNQLVKHHPDHVKGLILLGDIYINNIKDLDAAEKVTELWINESFVLRKEWWERAIMLSAIQDWHYCK